MAVDGSLIFDTEVDTDGVKQGVNDINDIFGDMLNANILGNLITSAMQTAGSALSDFAKQGIELASDLQEVQNVVDTTFGDGAAQIYAWSDAAAEAFGMSSLQAQKFNGTLGAMLKSMGLTEDAVMQMSTDMVGLAGDMASFYNLDVEEAFNKIRSGISGETEPLKQLGINMSVANLEAYALSQGIEKAYSAMTQAEQAQLRYNYLMSVTADAQGDFAKTSDSFANQQRILDLTFDNLSATLGEQLLPALNESMDLAIDKLPRIEPIVESIGKKAADAIGFVVDNGETLISVIGGVAGAVITYKAATSGATIAQNLFNAAANANPYVLLASAVVAVGTAVGTYALQLDLATNTAKELENAAKDIIASSETEARMVEVKALRYKELYNQYKDTGIASDELARLAEELQGLAPGTIDLIDEETEAYRELDNSIQDVIASIRQKGIEEAKANTISGFESNMTDSINNIYEAETKVYHALAKLPENAATELEKANRGAYKKYFDALETGGAEFANNEDEWKIYSAIVEYYQASENLISVKEKENKIIEENQRKIEEAAAIYEKMMGATSKKTATTSELGTTPYSESQKAADKAYADARAKEAEEIIKARETATEKLQEKWKKLEHEYASSTTMTEEELYAKKREIWNKYGDESYKDHWDYYEDLIQHDKDFAAEQARLAEENAAKEKAELEKRYDEQFDIVDDGLNDIISAHKEAYSELERQREAYRNKLMAIGGDLFSVDVSEGENGEEITTYTVNNLDEQLRKMKEYHRQISSLKKQGASAGLLEELTSLGDEESAQFAKYLSGMSQTEFAKINELYTEKNKLAEELSTELYQSEAQAISDSMTSALADLATSAYAYGASAAEQFSAGFSATANELGVGALYNQIQAQGANKSYDNYVTTTSNGNQTLNVNVDVTGKSAIMLDGKMVGESVTNYQSQQKRSTRS